MAKRPCDGTNRRGAPCGAAAVGAERGDPRYCLSHQPAEVRESLGFGGPQPGAGRPRNQRPINLARELVVEHAHEFLRPYLRTLGLDFDAAGQVVKATGGGAVLVGRDKEGGVFPSDVEDLGAKIAASERLFDRVFGKPRQALEHTGDDGGPIRTEGGLDLRLLTDDELRALQAIHRAVGERAS
jgi:hypothetical protein